MFSCPFCDSFDWRQPNFWIILWLLSPRLKTPINWWHSKFHQDDSDILMEHWVKNLEPGDRVCTCVQAHETIKSIDLKAGTCETVEGNTHDIWHCLEPVDHTLESHQEDLQAWRDSREA